MENKKKTFTNPIIKDRIEILENSKDKLSFRTFLEAGGGQNQLHYHTKINETFKIIKGELKVIINTEKKILIAGNEYLIPPYTHHMFYNASKQLVIFDVEVVNPQKMINGLQIMYGLTNDKKTDTKGLPNNLFHTAIGLNMMDAFSPKVPYYIQKTGLVLLSKIGKILGIEKNLLKKYSTK